MRMPENRSRYDRGETVNIEIDNPATWAVSPFCPSIGSLSGLSPANRCSRLAREWERLNPCAGRQTA